MYMARTRKLALLAMLLVCAASLVYYFRISLEAANESNGMAPPRLVLIVGGPDPFWKEVILGAHAAAKDYGVALDIIEPEGGGKSQSMALVNINVKDYDGLAISPLAPSNQALTISKLATQIKVVTYDNDAENSLRHLYIGTNNVTAGQLAADLVKRALPDGGEIAIFVGDDERSNARDRRRSLINSLRGQSYRGASFDEDSEHLGESLKAGKFTIVATYFDESNSETALANAKQALNEYPELAGMVALYGYNGPACLKALHEAKKVGTVKLIAFDNHEATLSGVADGAIEGTVVQDPYLYGYESIEALTKLCQGNSATIPVPGAGSISLPCAIVDQDNLGNYQEKLHQRRGAVEPNQQHGNSN